MIEIAADQLELLGRRRATTRDTCGVSSQRLISGRSAAVIGRNSYIGVDRHQAFNVSMVTLRLV